MHRCLLQQLLQPQPAGMGRVLLLLAEGGGCVPAATGLAVWVPLAWALALLLVAVVVLVAVVCLMTTTRCM
jgi:hypothetical protein